MSCNIGNVDNKAFASSMGVMLEQVKAAKKKMIKAEEVINIETKDTRSVLQKRICSPKPKIINPKAFDEKFQKQQDKEVKNNKR